MSEAGFGTVASSIYLRFTIRTPGKAGLRVSGRDFARLPAPISRCGCAAGRPGRVRFVVLIASDISRIGTRAAGSICPRTCRVCCARLARLAGFLGCAGITGRAGRAGTARSACGTGVVSPVLSTDIVSSATCAGAGCACSAGVVIGVLVAAVTSNARSTGVAGGA